MRTCSENTHRVKNLKEKQSKQPLAFVRILLLFKLWNVNHQHLTSSTSSCPLSFPLSLSLSHVSLWALSLCPHAWLTPPPPPLLSPIALHHSLAPAALPPSNFLSSCIPLFQPSLNLYHPLPLPPPLRLPLFPSFCLSLSLSVSLSRSRSLSLSLSRSLSLWLSCRPFLSCSPTVGKQLIMGSRGGWPCGEGSSSVIKVTLSAESEGGLGGGQREGRAERVWKDGYKRYE